MRLQTKRGLAILWIAGVLCSTGQVLAQQAGGSTPPPQPTGPSTTDFMKIDYSRTRVSIPYFAPSIPDISLENSARLRSLIQNSKIELTLDDAIALALENN